MELNLDEMSEETFFSEEVIAVQLRNAGFPWREQINYADLPPRLQKIGEFIIPIVNGVKTLSDPYKQSIRNQFRSIIRGLHQTSEGQMYDSVYKALKNAAMTMFLSHDVERSIFAFICLAAEICRWLYETNQEGSVYGASAALQFVFTTKFPGEFITILERLRDYV